MSTIKANPKGGVITLTKGNDTVYLGQGADIIRGGANSGNNVIYNYDGSKDIIEIAKGTKLTNDMQSYSLVGNDIILKLGKTKITLKNMLNKVVRNRLQGSKKIDVMSPYKCLPKNISYAKNGSKYDWTKIVTNANFYNGKAEMDEYNDNLKTLDARKTNKGWLYIEGSKRNDVIYTASGSCDCKVRAGAGNDTIYLGKAYNRVIVDTDDGNDVIYNFESNKDHIQLANGYKLTKGVLGYSMIGNDLQLRVGKTKLTLKNMVNKYVVFSWDGNYGGKVYNFYENQPKNVSYAKSGKITDWTKVVTNANFSGKYDMGTHNENLKTFDARATSKKINEIIGRSKKDDIIYAGKGGTDKIFGRSGNDTIYCGSGKDVIWFGKGDGKDTIVKSGKNDVARLYDINNIKQVTAKCVKGVMTIGIKGTSDTFNMSGWKAGSSLSTVQLANGAQYSLSANGALKKIK